MVAPITAVEVDHVYKSYSRGKKTTPVLRGVTMRVSRGECVFLVGPSGSGKSSLLSIVGCMLAPDSGRVAVLGHDVVRLSLSARAALRREKIGFLFQTFHLIRGLSALENVMVPLVIADQRWALARARAKNLLATVDMLEEANADPRQLSVGQCQRVALARALAADPDLILTDEPTASLDSASGRQAMQLLRSLTRDCGKTVIGVTHDQRVLPYCDRVLHLEDGVLVEQEPEILSTTRPLPETIHP